MEKCLRNLKKLLKFLLKSLIIYSSSEILQIFLSIPLAAQAKSFLRLYVPVFDGGLSSSSSWQLIADSAK
jgi:hypothetical protein